MSTTEIESGRSSEAKEFYLWEPPEKQISIYLSYDVIDQLQQEAMQGLGAVPRRGVEIGGVLLGAAQAGEPRIVKIQEFVLVKCEYASGPSYSLSDKDKKRLEAVLRKWPIAPESTMYPVGFFRSHTRKDLFLSDADAALCSQYFSKPENVFLVVRPFVTRTSQAGFFFWEKGQIAREAPYQDFPFSRKELGGGDNPSRARRDRDLDEIEDVAEAPAPGDGVQERPAEARVPPFLMPPPQRSSGLGKWLLALAFLVLGAVAGFLGAAYFRDAPVMPAENLYSFGLSAIDDGGHVHIKWNRRAPAVLAARGGRITISDNGSSRVLDLDLRQLQNGTVIYRRIGDKVGVKLEAFVRQKPGQKQEGDVSLTESVEVKGK